MSPWWNLGMLMSPAGSPSNLPILLSINSYTQLSHLPIPPIHLTHLPKTYFEKGMCYHKFLLFKQKNTLVTGYPTIKLPIWFHPSSTIRRPPPSMLHWARGRQQDVWTYFLDVHNVNLHLGLSPPPWISQRRSRLKVERLGVFAWLFWWLVFFRNDGIFWCLSPKTRKKAKKQVGKGRVDSCLGGIKAKQVGTNSISKSACCRLGVQTFYIIWSVSFDGRLHQLVIFHVHFLSSWQREKKSWNKWYVKWRTNDYDLIPTGSMYGIFTYIHHKNPNKM